VGEISTLVAEVTPPTHRRFRRQAKVGITVEGDLDPVADALTTVNEVDYGVVTAGSFDLMVEVVCGDEDHLLGLINKRIRALPGLRTTESFVYLKLTKQTRRWGIR
jgi:Lrp/AsnC family transcriptional regulator, regulator for asnA, asnC and gidA